MEGCLSLPHFYGNVQRSQKHKIRYLDEEGLSHTQTFLGLSAQIVQHEIDHLNGRLFIDELLKQKRPLFEYKNGEWEELRHTAMPHRGLWAITNPIRASYCINPLAK